MLRTLYLLWQCSWGAPQTLVGLVVFLRHIRDPHFWYKGALVTRWKATSGVSLGLFVFAGARARPEDTERLLVHEYGHTIQSLLLGPLYLPVIGLPSYLWCNIPALVRRRRERHIPYSAFYTESWANRLGERTTGERAL